MADPKTPDAPKALTAAEAAKRVRRTVMVGDTEKQVSVKEDEVFAFRNYGSHVVVVTVDGRKLSSADVAAQAKA